MKQYNVTGMSCAACSARVEKAVSKVPGVSSCSVSLLTNSMGVEGTASEQEIVAAVEAAGYGASPKQKASASADAKGQSAGTVSYTHLTLHSTSRRQRQMCIRDSSRDVPGGRRSAERSRDAKTSETSDCIGGILTCTYVFFNGTYDVELAASVRYGG